MTERACVEIQEAFRKGALSDAQAEHIPGCPDCQRALEPRALAVAVPSVSPSAAAVARCDAHLAALGSLPARAPLPWAWIVALAAGLLFALIAGGRHPSPAPETRDAWQARPHIPLSPRELPLEATGDPRSAVRGVSE